MKTWKMRITASLVICLLLFSTGIGFGAAEVKIFLDGQPLVFDSDSGLPFIDTNNRTQVPFARVLESFGATISWEADTRTAVAVYDGIEVRVPIGEKRLSKDKVWYGLDAQAQIVGNRTFLPVRAVVESFGAAVTWDPSLNAVNIIPGALVTPTYKPISKVALGDTVDHIQEVLGTPQQVVESAYGFQWWIYHQAYEGYYQVGIGDGLVQAVYTTDLDKGIELGFSKGATRETVENKLGEPEEGIKRGNVIHLETIDFADVYKADDHYTWYFYDQHDMWKLNSVLVVDKAVEESPYLDRAKTEDLRVDFEVLVLDLTNAMRVKQGLSPLTNHGQAGLVARAHSVDMAEKNYFDHVNPEGKSPFDRMHEAGLTYSQAGENLAAGQPTPIIAVEGWMNSKGHRTNMLGDFESLGSGVAFGGEFGIYYGQNFLTPR